MAVKELVKPEQDEQNITESPRIILDFSGVINFTDDLLFEFCAKNRELQIEKTKEGKLIVMSPMGDEGANREGTLTYFFKHWERKRKIGVIFSPSAGFTLPNGAMRSPDVAFIAIKRWKEIPLSKRKKFAPICPDFVVELRSESDNLNTLKEKMTEWLENGCRLAWLIDPLEEKAYIYRPNKEVELIDSFDRKLSGEDVLPDFELELSELREEKE